MDCASGHSYWFVPSIMKKIVDKFRVEVDVHDEKVVLVLKSEWESSFYNTFDSYILPYLDKYREKAQKYERGVDRVFFFWHRVSL